MSPVRRCGEFPLSSLRATLRSESIACSVEDLAIDDCRMLAFVHLAAIGDLADIEPVLQHVRERTDRVALRSLALAVRELAGLGFNSSAFERSCEPADRAELDVQREYFSNEISLLRHCSRP